MNYDVIMMFVALLITYIVWINHKKFCKTKIVKYFSLIWHLMSHWKHIYCNVISYDLMTKIFALKGSCSSWLQTLHLDKKNYGNSFIDNIFYLMKKKLQDSHVEKKINATLFSIFVNVRCKQALYFNKISI